MDRPAQIKAAVRRPFVLARIDEKTVCQKCNMNSEFVPDVECVSSFDICQCSERTEQASLAALRRKSEFLHALHKSTCTVACFGGYWEDLRFRLGPQRHLVLKQFDVFFDGICFAPVDLVEH